MSQNSPYLNDLLRHLLAASQQQPPFNNSEPEPQAAHFLTRLTELSNCEQWQDQQYQEAQQLVESIIANYPLLTPALNRDLLWLLGGNCMHFLGDEEIASFQRIDEYQYEAQQKGEALSFKEAKLAVMKPH